MFTKREHPNSPELYSPVYGTTMKTLVGYVLSFIRLRNKFDIIVKAQSLSLTMNPLEISLWSSSVEFRIYYVCTGTGRSGRPAVSFLVIRQFEVGTRQAWPLSKFGSDLMD